MTYLPETRPTHEHSSHDILPGLPDGPDMVDTSALRAVIPAFIMRIAAMICPEGVQRGAVAQLWGARRLFASLYRAEVQNFKTWLTNTMQADRYWQRQVREDLGGDAALIRWDKRYAKMTAGETCVPSGAARAQTKRASRKRRIDRHGQFRLARISCAEKRQYPYRAPLFTSPRDAWLRFNESEIIDLTPDQLRPPTPKACRESRGPALQSARMNAAGANSPKFTRRMIVDMWRQVYHAYGLFNFKITNLDLMIHSAACRRRPMLPV